MNALAFRLPPALEATGPPEARGVPRDAVRLMVSRRDTGQIAHRRFSDLAEVLVAGDLLVVNASATLPAAVSGRRRDGSGLRVHFATRVPELDARWRVVELRTADGSRPERGRAGEKIALATSGRRSDPGAAAAEPGPGAGDAEPAPGAGDAELELVAPYATGSRLLLARLNGGGTVEELLSDHGEPIRYGYVKTQLQLEAYQNVYATTPGSAEMPSAGRPFTARLITALVARGVAVAPIILHTGVSSPERHEAPFPEQYEVPASTARQVQLTRRRGGRVIAVGTTVVRALETVARADGSLEARAGWTGLVIEPDTEIRAVDGMITGWHEPEASHLQMLTAIAGEDLLERSYDEALRCGYLWHEFGDSHLILP